jgi:hypothetical protein
MIFSQTYAANELLDQVIIDLMQGMFLALTDLTSEFLFDAQALCVIFMLLYFGVKGFEFISGDKRMEVMPLLRPFAISLVVIFWPQFIDIINFPLQVVSDTSKTMYHNQIGQVDAIIIQRYQLMDSVAMRLSEMSYEVEQASNNDSDLSISKWLGLDMFNLTDAIKAIYIVIVAKLKFMIITIIEFIVITIFQALTYLVYFLQIIFGAVMVILGPFAFAMSILPGFRDSYLSWISRYISIGLYTTIANIILSISFTIIRYGVETDISLIEQILGNDPQSQALFMAYITSVSVDFNLFIVALLMGALAMLTVPIISTWIVSTSGAGSALGVMTGAAMKAGMSIKK